jgi:hypothetical protein
VKDANGTIGGRATYHRPVGGEVQKAIRAKSHSRLVNFPAAVLALVGIILPTEMQISIGEAKFTPGRIGIILLLLPALSILFQKGRRLLLCDFLAFATASWLIVAAVATAGLGALASAAGAEALEFLGGYLVARAYFFGLPALDTFVRVLKAFAIVAIILGIADSISGRLIVHDTIASIVRASVWPEAGYRHNMVRAASTFDHAILFGTFCALTAAILLYWEQSLLRRILSVGFCFLGCLLSLSSAALLAFLIALSAYCYDRLMRQYSWRWSAFWVAASMMLLVVSLVTNNPLGWVLTHLTMDPQTGYFRLMIWEVASIYIAQAPLTGYAYSVLGHGILDATVDSVWLVRSLQFGVPMVILLFLTNVAAFLPTKGSSENRVNGLYLDGMRRAFTLVLLLFMFNGLTVHFWNYLWIFWGLCIGIRASLRELSIELTRQPHHYSQPASARTVGLHLQRRR